ncbi:hypothetical protein [Pseudomonas costantinii]|uniref:Uncharacterized protein n=1 Tax=Pseudomonas costantinii TaxID=168469 RepID=A0A1S2UE18_9PSED|nr:hypothetical protein [Pseudomonas costantinii]OIN44525.1 hypothetical protein BFL40_30015 [Pseudomonas costantinii]SED26768.1 hypothetical protein SAMN04515675_0496 [Pseudomonas costantinii]
MLDEFGKTIPGTEDAPVDAVDEHVPDVEPVAEVAPEVAPVVEAQMVEAAQAEPEAPAADVVDKLEKILSAVGYTLPPLWAEAVALARKTI